MEVKDMRSEKAARRLRERAIKTLPASGRKLRRFWRIAMKRKRKAFASLPDEG